MSGSYNLTTVDGISNPAFENDESGKYRKSQVGTMETKMDADGANGYTAHKPEVNGKPDGTVGEGGSDADGTAAAAKPVKPPMVGVGEVVRHTGISNSTI